MSGNDKKSADDYKKILEEESSVEEHPDTFEERDTHVNDQYIESLKKKIEKSEDERESPPSGGVKHTFVSHKKEEQAAPPSGAEPDAPASEKRKRKALFPFSEKTTQKLEEEIRKSSSSDSEPPPVAFRSERPSWKGNSVYVLCGPDAGKSFYITGGKIRIGRGLDNDVVLKDISISRKHCILTREGDLWSVEDLGSDNGTFVDGKPVKKLSFKPGQYVQLGRTIIIVETSQ